GAAWAVVRIAPEDPHVAMALLNALASCGAEKVHAFLYPSEFTEPSGLCSLPYSGGKGWPSTRRTLIRAIGNLRPQTSETLAALFHELRDGDYGAQATAAEVLGEIRPSSPEIITALKDTLLRTSGEHMPEWRDLLALTPPHLDNAHAAGFKVNPTPEVLMVFRDEMPARPIEHLDTIYLPGKGFRGWGLRLRVVRALGRIGAPARELLPALLEDCTSETRLWRFDAALAAWRIGGDCPQVTGVFERGLHVADRELAQLAVTRLSEAAAEFPSAVTLLVSGLQHPDHQVRLQVLRSLPALGTNAVSALPNLLVLIHDRSIRTRDAATKAIQAVQRHSH
ncbi:MAG: HEAT repeat domain-containing protein, partial [Limisphaerales bacterium]